ncbi:MAG: HypC/HybG/HupF family hydrogenase formation chaperone [Pseudomonadota bacterium]|nr:HypC/HybG/HupF family hydrogenase formation chaperone [Pseudomonadota bacterium]
MCLAIPARLVELLPGEQAIVNLGGIRKTVSIALIDDAQIDDYVIVHVGHAIGKIDPEEAARTLALFGELAQAQAESDALCAAAKAPA